MIISASYKTDIPSFYGRWFMNRLKAGHCRMVNPYGGQVYTVDLRPGAVDGFVFWTRNPGPFLDCLIAVRDRGFPFVVQQTITGYPRALDYATIAPAAAAGHLGQIARAFGPRAGVWRYDPVVFTSLTPPAWHRKTFRRLSAGLRGAVDEVVVSFAQVYRKTRRNMDVAARAHRFRWRDPGDDEKRDLLDALRDIAGEHRMALTLCGQPHLLVEGAGEARCIDAGRLGNIAGRPLEAAERAHRKTCRCFASRDIGEYDTCPHGCVYCYAVDNRTIAKHRHRAHDPAGEFLFPPPSGSPAPEPRQGASP